MARKQSNAGGNVQDETERQLGRIARLLGLLVVKGEPQPAKILTLLSAGFTQAETAEMLGTTPNNVAVTVYRESKQKASGKSRGRKG